MENARFSPRIGHIDCADRGLDFVLQYTNQRLYNRLTSLSMAYSFELEADCVEKDAAEAFGSHFSGITYALPDGRECRVGPAEISCFEDAAHHVRCCIVPTGASLTGYKDVLK